MGHFAKVVNGKVTNVIVADEDFFESFVDNSPGQWIKTSYNTRGGIHYDPTTGEPSEDQSKALRKNFAGIGFNYDQEREAFFAQQPFPSWSLDEFSFIWQPPVPYPDGKGVYEWDEQSQSWIQVITN